jgi:hypothetical protein
MCLIKHTETLLQTKDCCSHTFQLFRSKGRGCARLLLLLLLLRIILLPWLVGPEDMQVVYSLETMVYFYQTTHCNIPGHFLLNLDMVHIKMLYFSISRTHHI